MQIHVVQSGQNLSEIAEAYNTTTDALTITNELTHPDELVVGQSLVIPISGRYYWVRSGDSLYNISQLYNIPYTELARINNISLNESLPIGTRLYIPPRVRVAKEVNAYVEPRGTEVSETLTEATRIAAPYLTYLAPFSYQVQRDGTLQSPLLDNFPEIARENGATLMMVVTNLEEGSFSAELGRMILTDEAFQDTLLDNIIEIGKEYNFSDIHFDFEFLPVDLREAYNNFLRKAKRRLSEEGFLMSTALAPKTSRDQRGAWYEAHDYGAHGEIADFVVLMTYEWGYSGGPPMAVSPIGPVRDVVEYALTEMPSEKIMLGQNLYGYDWTLPYVEGGPYARAISPQQAIDLAREFRQEIEYDIRAQAPHFKYVDLEGNVHEVWFEDARSIQAKFDLIRELNLRGISYWKLGLDFPQNWLLLNDNFEVIKTD